MGLARKLSPAVVSMGLNKRPVGLKQVKSGMEINKDYIYISTAYEKFLVRELQMSMEENLEILSD